MVAARAPGLVRAGQSPWVFENPAKLDDPKLDRSGEVSALVTRSDLKKRQLQQCCGQTLAASAPSFFLLEDRRDRPSAAATTSARITGDSNRIERARPHPHPGDHLRLADRVALTEQQVLAKTRTCTRSSGGSLRRR